MTGAGGQLGSDLVSLLQGDHEVFGLTRTELDITDFRSVMDTMNRLIPDVLIHSAAFTAVDRAELEADAAYQVNAYGTRNIAVAARHYGAKLIYISTDYVFDGKSRKPYNEFDAAHPINVYGKSKLAGEELVKALTTQFFIVRTSWVYGKQGNNFVKNMIKLAQQNTDLASADDQFGCPTYTIDLARFLAELMTTEKYGIYHATNGGFCSRFEWTKVIVEELRLPVSLKPVSHHQFPLPAARPVYSVLDPMSIRLGGFTPIRPWREALREFLHSL